MNLQKHLGVYTQNCLKIDFCVCILSPYLYLYEVIDIAVQLLLLNMISGGGGIRAMEDTVGRRPEEMRKGFVNVVMPKA